LRAQCKTFWTGFALAAMSYQILGRNERHMDAVDRNKDNTYWSFTYYSNLLN
jgi:hypothetical protein